MANKKVLALGCLGVLVLGVLIVVLYVTGVYNGLVGLDQKVQAQWGQVENDYQRRADLIPNLVETVKGAAAFEKDTFTAVTEARAKVGQVQVNPGQLTPEPSPSSRRPRTACPRPCRGFWSSSRSTPSSRPPRTSRSSRPSSRAPRTGSPSSGCASTRRPRPSTRGGTGSPP